MKAKGGKSEMDLNYTFNVNNQGCIPMNRLGYALLAIRNAFTNILPFSFFYHSYIVTLRYMIQFKSLTPKPHPYLNYSHRQSFFIYVAPRNLP